MSLTCSSVCRACYTFIAAICLAPGLTQAAPDETLYEQKVKPLLMAKCMECHSTSTHASGFSISTVESVIRGGNKHGQAVLEGQPGPSPLLKLLKGELAPRMPLGGHLTDSEIATVEDWVRSLPPQPIAISKSTQELWPFQKPVKPDPPAVQNAGWVRNPIDAFILKKLESNRIPPAPPALKGTLARRVYFDLIGLPPTREELKAFEESTSPTAYEALVDKLLADPRYGERWGRHWLDLVRYGETSGLEGDGSLGNAWRYRDWVIEAFNSDMPYDQFVIKQLAGGDEHSKTRNNYSPDIQGHVPLAFLRLAPWDRSNLVAEEVRQNYLNEVTTTTASVFLGLTMGCARCHNHKYDPIPTKDFYRFQAFFNAIKVEDVEVPFQDGAQGELAEAHVKRYEEQLKSGPERQALDALEKRLVDKLIAQKKIEADGRELQVADLRLELRRPEQKIFSPAEKLRHARMLEDATRTQDLEERQTLDSFEKKLLPRLAEAYSRGVTAPLGRFDVLSTEDLRTEIKRGKSRYFTEAELEEHRALTARLDIVGNRLSRWKPLTLSVVNVPGPPIGPGLAPTHVLIGGDYKQLGEVVAPGFPSAITGSFEPTVLETDRYRQFPTRGWRMTLAKWIASPENPLIARVMMNRLWQHHFGRGIVETPSDFGRNGARPTHPELLDWLAVRFLEEKWSLKALHRLMLTSSTYRQSSENPAAMDPSTDVGNSLLWRFNRRRLQAEAIRDSILFVSGQLNPARGGPSVFPPLPDDLADFARYGREGGVMWEPNEDESDNRRRSIYTFQRRSMPLPMMSAFDAPVFNEPCERRSTTTTPLQALSMLNGDLVNEGAIHFAQRIVREAGPGRLDQISRAFEIVLNRKPRPEELARFAQFDGSLEGICRVLLDSNEFLYVE